MEKNAMAYDESRSRLDRRRFLLGGAAAGIGWGLFDLAGGAWAAPSPPQIRRYRRLGRTGDKRDVQRR